MVNSIIGQGAHVDKLLAKITVEARRDNDQNSTINNIVQYCYNSGVNHKKGILIMQPGPQGAEFPSNLFNTWLDYRESKGQSRADIIREVNAALGRKYDNDRFYKWKKQKLTVAEPVVLQFINPELPAVLKWFYKTSGYPVKGIDFQALADAIRPAIKDLSLE